MNQEFPKTNQRKQVAISDKAFDAAKRLQEQRIKNGIPSTIGGIISELILKEDV